MSSQKYDALIVLGYTLNNDGSPPPILTSRLIKALDYYTPTQKIILSGGGFVSNSASSNQIKITEAQAMKQYLTNQGVIEKDIVMEEHSKTTFMNAYFTRLNYLEPMGLKKVAVVSSDFHERLVRYCFDLVLGGYISYDFISVQLQGSEIPDEIRKWDSIITKMLNTCYPKLFSNISKGDMIQLGNIVEESMNDKLNKSRIKFERCLCSVLHLEPELCLKGIV